MGSKQGRSWAWLGVGSLVCGAAVLGAACSSDDKSADIISSRSYRGHESDVDITNFVNVYPATVGTRLDDCQTCHRASNFTEANGGSVITKNPCDFCHLIQNPETGFIEPLPVTYRDTLNPYGIDYFDTGRSRDALAAIGPKDSDGDGYGNQVEIADVKYPGDPDSHPGQQSVPLHVFTMAELQAMPATSQFLLANSARQAFDEYATYKGVTIRDLLVAAGVEPTAPEIQGITIIAPDGYMMDMAMDEVNQAFPTAVFYGGLGVDTLGATCGLVEYPDPLPAGLASGQPIPGEPWLLLAYERDGVPLDMAVLDITTAKLQGEGPFRLIVPQAVPGAPDRGSQYSPSGCGDEYDYDQTKDHNAGAMVRGVVGIRVNPLPAGYEDFDYRNGGWAFVANQTVAVFGYGVVVQ
jgi:hypothetical protein